MAEAAWSAQDALKTRGIKSISGELHQKDSCYRKARAIDAKVGMLVVDDVTFMVCHHKGSPPPSARAHVKKTKEYK